MVTRRLFAWLRIKLEASNGGLIDTNKSMIALIDKWSGFLIGKVDFAELVVDGAASDFFIIPIDDKVGTVVAGNPKVVAINRIMG